MTFTSSRAPVLHAAWFVMLCAVALPAWACEYYAEHFQIIHPSSAPAARDASEVAIFMELTQISAPDRLLGASTPVAQRVEVRQPPPSGDGHRGIGAVPNDPVSSPEGTEASSAGTTETAIREGIAIEPGQEVSLSLGGGHLVMHGVNTQLHEGRQYPLTLTFEKAGDVYVEFVVGDH